MDKATKGWIIFAVSAVVIVCTAIIAITIGADRSGQRNAHSREVCIHAGKHWTSSNQCL